MTTLKDGCISSKTCFSSCIGGTASETKGDEREGDEREGKGEGAPMLRQSSAGIGGASGSVNGTQLESVVGSSPLLGEVDTRQEQQHQYVDEVVGPWDRVGYGRPFFFAGTGVGNDGSQTSGSGGGRSPQLPSPTSGGSTTSAISASLRGTVESVIYLFSCVNSLNALNLLPSSFIPDDANDSVSCTSLPSHDQVM